MDLKELLAKMKAKNQELKDIHGKMAVAASDEDRQRLQSEYDAKSAEFKQLEARYQEAKAISANQNVIDEAITAMTTDQSGVNMAHQEHSTSGKQHRFEVDASEEADSRLKKSFFMRYVQGGAKTLSGNEMGAIQCNDSRVSDTATEAVRLPKDMAKIMRLQTPGINLRFTPNPLAGKVILSTDAVGYNTDSGASHLVAPDFRPQLLAYPIAMANLFDYCRLITAVNGTATWPKLDQASAGNFGGVAFTWKATEGADKGETAGYFTDFTVSTSELSAWTEVSLTALRRSAIDLEAELLSLFRDACKYEWSRVILRGTGTNQPLGLIATGSGISTVHRTANNKVDWADLTNLEYAIPQGLRMGSRYFVDDSVEKYLKQSVDSDKRPLFTADVHSQIRNMLAGYPYNAHEHGPTLGTKGDVVFGNPMQYAFAMEEDIAIARSEHAAFKQGRIVFRLICFVGGKPIHGKAFCELDVAST